MTSWAMIPTRSVYCFWFLSEILTQVVASSEQEAWAKAGDDLNVTISCNRPFETPVEFRRRLGHATVTVYPL